MGAGSDNSIGEDATLAGDDSVVAVAHRLDVRAGSTVGRYIALERLGAGGMGIVWSAYDPELDRKVAIKFLHPSSDGTQGHARLLREAQAMARLAHPNVVAVYDVGTFGEAVFVAMELISGTTLGAWRKRRSRAWSETLQVLVEAGRGLAAAHSADLVHRDIKPDNIMIGDDGRVRVMDFGLARAELPAELDRSLEPLASQSLMSSQLTVEGSVMGTPAYMAPEQYAGTAADARSDQFSFCVTCWEILHGERPFHGGSMIELATRITEGAIRPPPSEPRTPRWIDRALARGLSADPDARYPSLDALLHELTSGRRRARMRAAGVAVACVAIGTVGVTAHERWEHRQRVAACDEAADAVSSIWPGDDGASSTAVDDGFSAVGVGYARDSATRTRRALDAYASELAASVKETCRQEVDEPSAAIAATRACLDDRRSGLELFVSALSNADRVVVRRAVQSALTMPSVAACLEGDDAARRLVPDDETTAREVLRVRTRLDELETKVRLGHYDAALAGADDLLALAESTEFAPVIAEVHHFIGGAARSAGDYRRSEDEMVAAFETAAAVGHDTIAIEASGALCDIVGNLGGRPAEGHVWAKVAGAILEKTGETEGLRGAAYLAMRGNLEYTSGDLAGAERDFRRAEQLHRALLGDRTLAAANDQSRLGAVATARGDGEAAIEHYARALELTKSLVGPDHPDVSPALAGLGVAHRALGHREEATRYFVRERDLLARALGPHHVEVAHTTSNIGLLRLEGGDLEGADKELRRALDSLEKTLGPDHLDLSTVLVNLALIDRQRGDPERAEARAVRALAIREKALGPDHPAVARALSLVGEIHTARSRPEKAVRALERALEIMSTQTTPPTTIGEVELRLGDAVWELGTDDARAIDLVASALSKFAAEPVAAAANLGEANAWLLARPRVRAIASGQPAPRGASVRRQ